MRLNRVTWDHRSEVSNPRFEDKGERDENPLFMVSLAGYGFPGEAEQDCGNGRKDDRLGPFRCHARWADHPHCSPRVVNVEPAKSDAAVCVVPAAVDGLLSTFALTRIVIAEASCSHSDPQICTLAELESPPTRKPAVPVIKAAPMNHDHFIGPPGKKTRLKDYDPGSTGSPTSNTRCLKQTSGVLHLPGRLHYVDKDERLILYLSANRLRITTSQAANTASLQRARR